MAVNSVTKIDDHQNRAAARLPQKYKDAPKDWTFEGEDASAWEAVIKAFAGPSQDLENVMSDMLAERSLAASEGVNLNRIGGIVGADRAGLGDEDYRVQIVAQIAQNNSDTTAFNLENIVRVLLGDSLLQMRLEEDFPAKVDIQYSSEIPFVVDESNNLFRLQSDAAGGSSILPVTLPSGTYFPSQLRDLFQDNFETTLGEEIVVTFNQDRTYTFNLNNVALPDPRIYFDIAGPLYGFVVNTIVVATTTGSPVDEPPSNETQVLAALLGAKAAGVDINTQSAQFGTEFGFQGDIDSLGYGSLLPDNELRRISYYTSYIFPANYVSGVYSRVFTVDKVLAPDRFSLRVVTLPGDDATNFEAEVTGSGVGWYLIDADTVEWAFVGTPEYSSQDLNDGSVVAVEHYLTMQDVSGVDLGVIYRNGALSTFDVFYGQFAPLDKTQETIYDQYNPQGLGNEIELTDTTLGGGTYGTL